MKKRKSEQRRIKKEIHAPPMHSKRNPTSHEEELTSFLNSKLMYFQSKADYKDRPSWDEAFMLAAYEAATRASCLHIKTGAVIVKDKRIIAAGYNGAPQDIENCLERGCRKDLLQISQSQKRTGNCRGAHAERNAMDQIARENLKGTALYMVMFPCSDCAKTIVGNGIREVVYSIKYHEPDSLTRELFSEKGITIRSYTPDITHQFIRLMRVYNQRNQKEFKE